MDIFRSQKNLIKLKKMVFFFFFTFKFAFLFLFKNADGDKNVCYFEDTDLAGHDIYEKSLSNVHSCMQECIHNPKCFCFTFSFVLQKCFLKNSFAVRTKIKNANTKGLISGSKICENDTVCIEKNVDYYGNDIAMIDSNVVEECIHQCFINQFCFFYTFSSNKKKCFLKNKNGKVNRIENEKTIGLFSGPKNCKSESTLNKLNEATKAGCIEENVDYADNNLFVMWGNNAYYCLIKCREIKECVYFTFSFRKKECYLKNKFAIKNRIKNDETRGLISGSIFCLNDIFRKSCYQSRFEIGDRISGNDFLDPKNFWFFTENDPTNGYVNYVGKDEALQKDLFVVKNERVILYADKTNVLTNYQKGRDAIRITSSKYYGDGIYVLSLNHMPTGCGVWPAFWTCGSDPWPVFGEIDIIEGINLQTYGHVAFHTAHPCHMEYQPANFNGKWTYLDYNTKQEARNCMWNATATNTGCAIDANFPSFGESLNDMGGGYYVLHLDRKRYARVWYFPLGDIPEDLIAENPQPEKWIKYKKFMMANFPFGKNCDGYKAFGDQRIIINLSFCGSWSENDFILNPKCPGKGIEDCVKFVKNNPLAFQKAYWDINFFKFYKQIDNHDCSNEVVSD